MVSAKNFHKNRKRAKRTVYNGTFFALYGSIITPFSLFWLLCTKFTKKITVFWKNSDF